MGYHPFTANVMSMMLAVSGAPHATSSHVKGMLAEQRVGKNGWWC
jgi:hypothetical protein